MRTGKEPEKQMHYSVEVDFEAGLESRGSVNEGFGAGGPAFRCGVPLRGKRAPTRDAGSCADLPAGRVASTRLQVGWAPELSWRKRIRFFKQ